MLAYVLITPARNEARFIEKTISTLAAQTVRPVKWVIVSDGSTDGTDDIVKKYAAAHPWIDFVRMPERSERHFAGKILAFNAGRDRLGDIAYDAIGCVDGDVSFEPDHFAFLLRKLEEDPRLGLVGTPYRDPFNPMRDYRYVSLENVTGPCQLFGRRCFEEIGGYVPVKSGSVDRIADIAVRMHGWKTRTFPERVYVHHRPTGTAQHGILRSRFNDGKKDYSVGSPAIWQMCRSLYQMTKRPLVLGGLMLAAGYLWAAVRRIERPVSPEMADFYKREQMQRLKSFTNRMLHGLRPA